MSKLQCKDCRHFVQHYFLEQGKFYRVYCGHCTTSLRRKKLPDASVCEHFLPGISPEDELVEKEFLYKKLLERVLSMELAPKIENAPINPGGRG